MARLEVAPDSVQEIANGIGELINQPQPPGPPPPSVETADDSGLAASEARHQGRPPSSELTLGETLAVWKLTVAGFANLKAGTLNGDFVNWAEPTEFLYHQIKLNGEPQGFARSFTERGKPPIIGVDASDFAAKLGKALRKVDDPKSIVNHERDDAFFAADPVVRLLTIPACRIFALWLLLEPDQSRLMIVNATEPRSEFENERVLDSEEFYRALNIYRPLLGVG